jgi:NAD(P) transhydrogenase
MDYDFIVIGSGPAGQRAAIQAAKLEKKVAIIDRQIAVGGVCLHTGTIPSKTLREAVIYLSGYGHRGLYGQGYRLKADLTMDDLKQQLNTTIRREVEVLKHQLTRNGVQVFNGNAEFVDEHTVRVVDSHGESTLLSGEKFLISTGTHPVRPAGIPFDGRQIIDSDGILQLERIPRSLTVVGAGVIGIEYAAIFSAMDIEVTVVDGRRQMLGFMDTEIVEELIHLLRERGMVLRLGENVESVEKVDGHVVTTLDTGKRIRSDVVLFAAGRAGSTNSLKPQAAGVEQNERHLIVVNENYQTSQPHIYAAGDVIGFPSLASTSMEQGRQAACHAFGCSISNSLENFPFGIYAVPEMSMVGMTEQQLLEKGIPYETGVARLRETARGQIMGLEQGMLKLLISLDDRKLLGVHILGEGATELIHIGQAVHVLGGTLDYFLQNIFNYPTLAEAYKVAALDAWNRMAS